MTVRAFRMQLKPGTVEQYRLRHDAIWPELADLLRRSGIRDYSIFLDEESGSLFATCKLTADNRLDALPAHPLMRKWWDEMSPLMEVEADNRPREWPLKQVFHLP